MYRKLKFRYLEFENIEYNSIKIVLLAFLTIPKNICCHTFNCQKTTFKMKVKYYEHVKKVNIEWILGFVVLEMIEKVENCDLFGDSFLKISKTH